MTERERTARSLASALRAGRSQRAASLDETLAGLDRAPAFLKDESAVRIVPDGSVVLIKTVPVAQLWPGRIRRGRGLGWIHCSPPEGAPRLVAAVTGSCPARHGTLRVG